jgi:hypothetical protein
MLKGDYLKKPTRWAHMTALISPAWTNTGFCREALENVPNESTKHKGLRPVHNGFISTLKQARDIIENLTRDLLDELYSSMLSLILMEFQGSMKSQPTKRQRHGDIPNARGNGIYIC